MLVARHFPEAFYAARAIPQEFGRTLAPPHARALLIRIAPRLAQERDDSASELARLCGNLPQALRLVASALVSRADLHPIDFAKKLKDGRELLKLTAADASLLLSYNLLTDGMQKRFRALAVFPGSFDPAGAKAVWEVEGNVAEDALGELLVYSLLEFNPGNARYKLHDLVRVFADARLDDNERKSAQLRHAGHYKDVLGASDDLFLKGGESLGNGLALFDLEWGNIQAGQSWAAARASEDKAAAHLSSECPSAGAYCLGLRLHPSEQIRWFGAGLAAARKIGDRRREGNALGSLGIAYDSLGEYRRAIEFHDQHLKIARDIGDRRGEGKALGNLGIAYDSLGEYRRAIEFHNQHLKIAREIGNRHGEGAGLGNLGIAYRSLGEYRRAIEFYEQSLKIAREIGNRHGEGAGLGNLGPAYASLGEYRRAIEFYEQHLKIARDIGDRRGESNTLWNMSLAFDKLGDRARTIANAEAALKIFEQIESPNVSKIRKQLAEWRGNA